MDIIRRLQMLMGAPQRPSRVAQLERHLAQVHDDGMGKG
jgi:hypothetical protein